MFYKTLQKTKLTSRDIQDTCIVLLVHDSRKRQASELGISRQALYNRIANYPEIEQFAKKVASSAGRILAIASIKASEKLIELVDNPDPRVALVASKEVLDRCGVINLVRGLEQNITFEIARGIERDRGKYGLRND